MREDIIEIIREEFGEENKFCKKVTYKSDEDPKKKLNISLKDLLQNVAVAARQKDTLMTLVSCLN